MQFPCPALILPVFMTFQTLEKLFRFTQTIYCAHMAITIEEDPLDLFSLWYQDIADKEINEPTAVTLATANANGRPSARMVLLKQHDQDGFVFYTNLESRKGLDLQENPYAALLFHWKSVRRQVRIEGKVGLVRDEEADAYFATRDRGSQIGAWASDQSRPLSGRFDLEKNVAAFTAKFGIGKVGRPPHWSGFRLSPDYYEFWDNGAFRLHDRLVYTKGDAGWMTEWLYP